MKAEEVLKLVNAGYTKDEIEAMNTDETPAADPAPAEEAAPEAAPEEAPAEPVAPAAPEAVNAEMEKRLDKLEAILEKIAANGIAGSAAPEPEKERNVVAEMLEHI